MIALSKYYVITDGEAQSPTEMLVNLERCLQQGYRLFQLRAKRLSVADYGCLATEALELTKEYQAVLLLNHSSPTAVMALQADGMHLTSHTLLQLRSRPLPKTKRVAASCHDQVQLLHAARLGVDFVTLSPVLATASHPEAVALGWGAFSRLCRETPLPVYALGAIGHTDLPQIAASGGYGMAGIRAFCDSSGPIPSVSQ